MLTVLGGYLPVNVRGRHVVFLTRTVTINVVQIRNLNLTLYILLFFFLTDLYVERRVL